jgi:hypothetical protein
MRPMEWPSVAGIYCNNLSVLPQRGPLGPFGVSGDL